MERMRASKRGMTNCTFIITLRLSLQGQVIKSYGFITFDYAAMIFKSLQW